MATPFHVFRVFSDIALRLAGHFRGGFDDEGNPKKRVGYMVTCAKDSDCRTRCPIHPLSGEHYYCQKIYSLYDYASTNDNGDIEFHQLDEAHSGDPDDEAMAREGDTGVCVDMNYFVRLHSNTEHAHLVFFHLSTQRAPCSQYHQTCPIKPLSQAISAIAGCADSWVSAFLCGMTVDRVGSDGSGVSITSGLAYPRTLVTATPDLDGDYRNTPEMTCSDALDCRQQVPIS